MTQPRTESAAYEAALRRKASGIRKVPGSRWREDQVTAVLAALLIAGLFLDGWNHINLEKGKLGTFFTPWHAVLYAGFSASTVWVLTRNSHLWRDEPPRPGARPLFGVPLRYRLALTGIGLATAGLIGDVFWHTLFGEEQGVARVIGPFHIFLFAGAGLLITAAFRSAWHLIDAYPVAPSFRTMLPPLISLTLITAMGSFLFQWLSAFIAWDPAIEIDRIPSDITHRQRIEETVEITSVARVVVTNLILMAPMLLALRRWRPPFGSFTLMFTAVAVFMSTLTEFRQGWVVLAACAGGLVADALVTRLRASPARPWAQHIVAGAAPLGLWTVYMVVLAVLYDVNWPLDLAIGTVVLSGLSGVVLSALMLPPALPAGAWQVGEGAPPDGG